ncbi:hypothetical protein GA830_10355 [Mesorhizobium sp. NBSH29]|uniref:hypothetical protein n=1 Tax=Mesorhizobium sp. NBSH29 TaxID=2654249 RepID=UPI0018969055|nr:hypothetical protein [Mesorhizobium sp. NBSH29]QPC87096.1 hypothetical protein GA830_10355 [Mesorhizobium sp. NBSH29]
MTLRPSSFPPRPNNLYETEPWATEALLRHVDISDKTIWEPAAGRHKMARVLARRALHVITSDIVHYEVRHDHIFDFLQQDDHEMMLRPDGIITNPPYGPQNRDAVRFCELALQRTHGIVAMLMTAKFDSGSTRSHLLRDNPRFRAKIVLVDRIQWFPGSYGGTEDHAWFVWGPQSPFPSPPILRYEGKATA